MAGRDNAGNSIKQKQSEKEVVLSFPFAVLFEASLIAQLSNTFYEDLASLSQPHKFLAQFLIFYPISLI
jgi:hypothetical protein